MPISLKTREKIAPHIIRVAKKIPNGLLAEKREILPYLLKDTQIKKLNYSVSALDELISYARSITVGDARMQGKTLQIESGTYFEQKKEKRSAQEFKKDYDSKEKFFLAEIEKLEKLLAASAHISKTPQTYTIKKQKSKHSQSTPLIFASDWHYEEEVKSETVSGLNEFTLAIAEQRIQNFVRNSTRLLEIHSKDTEIRDVIFCLGGDFITGDIHRDNIESCQLSPTEALWAVQNHIASCIEHYLKETDFNFIIPCHSGNHARTTKEQLWANEAGHSLEWLMYHNLKRWFKNEKRLTFMIADGLHLYTDVDGFINRTHHGHAIKYGGGVGGMTIPTNKAINQWNKGRWAHHDWFGHWHGYFPASNFNVNGSLIGFNPYAMSIKADPDKPAQTFALINHEEKMISINAKIFL